jgi:hypothetical protein
MLQFFQRKVARVEELGRIHIKNPEGSVVTILKDYATEISCKR